MAEKEKEIVSKYIFVWKHYYWVYVGNIILFGFDISLSSDTQYLMQNWKNWLPVTGLPLNIWTIAFMIYLKLLEKCNIHEWKFQLL